jgi:hypothetical protein
MKTHPPQSKASGAIDNVSDYRTDDSSFNSWLAWCERVSFAFFDS